MQVSYNKQAAATAQPSLSFYAPLLHITIPPLFFAFTHLHYLT